MTTARKLFGTDGVRGLANGDVVNVDTAMRLGQAAVSIFRQAADRRMRLIIGKDTRLSGDMLEAALTAGACSMGADVFHAGVLPTPGVAYLTRALVADAGVVISASHNPFADNGIKFFGPDGFKLPDSVESQIEAAVAAGMKGSSLAVGERVGRVNMLVGAQRDYAAALQAVLPVGFRLPKLRIVIDCAHGAASQVTPSLFESLGAQVSTIGSSPDGININNGVGAVHPQELQKAVLAAGADLGLALDGDADRAMLVDEQGAVVDGDEVMAMLAADMQARGVLKGGAVVATIMSNLGLEISLRERGIELRRTQVGDRYVVEEMRRGGFNLGGEQSGHLLFADSSTTGDGTLAGLQVVRLLAQKQQPLSQLKRVMTKLPQVLVNLRVPERRDLYELTALREVISDVERRLNGRGRVLVRYSGTEPLLRVMVEGEDGGEVKAHADTLAAAIRTAFGM